MSEPRARPGRLFSGSSKGRQPHRPAVSRQRMERSVPTHRRMTIQRMDHVGVVVDHLAAATAFSIELGLELAGEASVEGTDRIVGLDGVRADIVFVRTSDGPGRLQLTKVHNPEATRPGP